MKLFVISCNIMKDELLQFEGNGISFIFLEQSLHRTPQKMKEVIQEEINRIKSGAPSRRELDRAVNQVEASYLDRLEGIGGFGGKADQLNAYFTQTGNPDYFNEDLSRYRAIDPQDIASIAAAVLRDDARVVLSVVPAGKRDLASGPAKETRVQ